MTSPLSPLSDHLSWGEFSATRHAEWSEEQAAPPDYVLVNAKRFAALVFEPAHTIVGRLYVTSGYRCEGLNHEVGGAVDSKHLVGLAADLVPLDMTLIGAFEAIAASDVPYDQLIWEFGHWIHLGGSRSGATPRRELLMSFDRGVYRPWDPRDPRILRLHAREES